MRNVLRASWGLAALVFAVPCAPAPVRAPDCQPDCPCTVPLLFDAAALNNGVSQEALQRQYDALRAMRLEDVVYLPQGSILSIHGKTGYKLPAEAVTWQAGQDAGAVLEILKDVLLANGTEEFTVREVRDQLGGAKGILMDESIGGIPVLNSVIALRYDTRTLDITMAGGQFVADRNLERVPRISAAEAEQIAGGEKTEPTVLGYYLKCCTPAPARLVWAVSSWKSDSWIYYINAVTGLEVDRRRLSMN